MNEPTRPAETSADILRARYHCAWAEAASLLQMITDSHYERRRIVEDEHAGEPGGEDLARALMLRERLITCILTGWEATGTPSKTSTPLERREELEGLLHRRIMAEVKAATAEAGPLVVASADPGVVAATAAVNEYNPWINGTPDVGWEAMTSAVCRLVAILPRAADDAKNFRERARQVQYRYQERSEGHGWGGMTEVVEALRVVLNATEPEVGP